MTAATSTIPAAPAWTPRRGDRAFFGHPAGLGWLSSCELWERFSYYGMNGLLGLYLTKYLFLSEHIDQVAGIHGFRAFIEYFLGPMTPFRLGSFLAGLYGGLVYFTPIFGGLLADRVLGRTRTVVLGASLMALGHFLMAFESLLLLALACLVVGVGCFKGNIAAQVGDLYAQGDARRATAFQIFLLSVQIAVIGAPLICGTLGEKVAWHWGFGAAGVGMLIGLVVYVTARPWLPPEPPRPTRAERAAGMTTGQKLSRRDWQRIGVLSLLIPVLMLSIVGNQQFQIGYPLWADKHMDMVLGGFAVPVTWLQAIDAVISTGTMLLTIAFWTWWGKRRREPDELSKIALGSLIAAGGPALTIIAAGYVEHTGARVSFAWTLAYTVVNDFGFANILPVGLALYSRLAPNRLAGLVIGIYYLHLFVGTTFVGWLAGLQETMSGPAFWGMHAVLVASAGGLMLLAKLAFGHIVSPTPEEEAAAAALGEPVAAH